MAYDWGWTRDYAYSLWGRTVTVNLIVPCDEAAEIEEAQRDALARFNANTDQVLISVERSIFDYYQSICDECRERLGLELADVRVPRIRDYARLESLFQAKSIRGG